jgi:hypothetical protein
VKVGDLVKLSSYGKRLKCNQAFENRVGVVTQVEGAAHHPGCAVNVTWAGYDYGQMFHIRRDLKHAR